jgi:hypothetical protein
MRFAIRDDDTCFYTRAEELERVWGGVLGYLPVSLAVTPFALRAEHLGDPARFYQGPESGTLSENKELVGWMREQLRNGRISVMCHGATHEYRRTGPTTLVPEYVWKPAGQVAEETARARRHLEETFGVRVLTFVPPGNGISRASIEALAPYFDRMLASVSLRRLSDIRLRADYATVLARRVYFQLRHGIVDPFGGTLAGMRLFPSFPATVTTDWLELDRRLELCARLKADFIVGVHYWEIGETMKGRLERLFEKAGKLGYEFRSCDALLSAEGEAAPGVGEPGPGSVLGAPVRQEGSPAR